MDPVLNYIDGAFVPAQSSQTLDTVNPATGNVITTLPRSSSEDVEAATFAALRASPEWAATSMVERIGWLHRLADALEEDHDAPEGTYFVSARAPKGCSVSVASHKLVHSMDDR